MEGRKEGGLPEEGRRVGMVRVDGRDGVNWESWNACYGLNRRDGIYGSAVWEVWKARV